MIRLYIRAVVDETFDDMIYWISGWLYKNGYAFELKENVHRGSLVVKIYTRGLEAANDIFDFVLNGFGDAFRYFINRIKAEIEALTVCNGDKSECFDIWFEDLERLAEQEYLEVEERWQRMIEPMIYGQDDDPEYQEYLEAVEWERMVGIRNDGGMVDAVLYQEEYE
jgi:hypothetical protein